MKSTEIKAWWDEELPTYAIRIGTSRISNPGQYARVSLSGTNRTAGIFEVDSVNSMVLDKENLDRYIKLNENVAEALGYKPTRENLIRQSITVKVEPNVRETEIPVCNELTVYSDDINSEILKEYLKNRNYLIRGITESVPQKDIERHTSYSFNYGQGDHSSFRALNVVPSRPTVIVRESTDITVKSEPIQSQNTPNNERRKDRSSREHSSGRNTSRASYSNEDKRSEEETGSSYNEEEVGGGFEVSPHPPEHNFDDIVGLDSVKNHISNLTALKNEDLVEDLENEYGEGINEILPDSYTLLLYGPPGCGKTMVSHAIANKFQQEFNSQSNSSSAAFISVKGSDILASLQGQSESRIEAVFQEARNKAGEEGYAILFFDEIETLIPDRNASDSGGNDNRLTVAFLQEMNNIGDNVMVIGATNLPFTIDSAASRRFKTKLFVPHPSPDALAELWRKNLDPLDIQFTSAEYDRLGELSESYTPSEIDALLESEVQSDIVEGMLENDPVSLDMQYFKKIFKNTQPRVVEEYISSVDKPDLLSQDQMQGYRELEDYIEEYKNDITQDS